MFTFFFFFLLFSFSFDSLFCFILFILSHFHVGKTLRKLSSIPHSNVFIRASSVPFLLLFICYTPHARTHTDILLSHFFLLSIYFSYSCFLLASVVCLSIGSIFLLSFFSRVHATQQPALSVGWLVGLLVGWSVKLYFFYDYVSLTSLLLPKWSGDLKYGPCPPARDLGSRVSGLVLS